MGKIPSSAGPLGNVTSFTTNSFSDIEVQAASDGEFQPGSSGEDDEEVDVIGDVGEFQSGES